MVDFTTPNLPGFSEVYNTVAKKVDEIEGKVLDSTNLTATASSLTSTLSTDLTDLKAKTLSMIPELPSLPSVNLQSEITSLSQLTPGSTAYITKLDSINQKFGSGLKTAGYDFNTVISDGASAITNAQSNLLSGASSVSPISALSAAIPNLELPPGSLEAIEKAKAALQPIKDGFKELATKFEEDISENDDEGVYGDGYARDTLDKEITALASKVKSLALNFGTRAERFAKELEAASAQRREDEEFVDL